MKKRELGELVTFIPGINPTRAEKQFKTHEIKYYDQSSFEVDYNHDDSSACENDLKAQSKNNLSLNEGDLVISNSLQLAAMVGKINVGKVLSLNFTKVEFNSAQLDKRYFLYLFNANVDIKRQKERELQGNGSILRIPLKALNQIVIPVVSMEEQIKVGAIYTKMLKLQSKLIKYTELVEQFTGLVLEENLKEK